MSPQASLLIIDDDETLTWVLRRVLKAYEVTIARSSEEALALVTQKDFDGILCDFTLPGASGAAFFKKIAELRPGQERRVRFMTGGPTDAEACALAAHETGRILQKPFDIQTLKAFVADLVA
jgi:DNA-binding NtrC family response regulator